MTRRGGNDEEWGNDGNGGNDEGMGEMTGRDVSGYGGAAGRVGALAALSLCPAGGRALVSMHML